MNGMNEWMKIVSWWYNSGSIVLVKVYTASSQHYSENKLSHRYFFYKLFSTAFMKIIEFTENKRGEKCIFKNVKRSLLFYNDCHQRELCEIKLYLHVINVVRCAISYHVHNLKNVNNAHGGVLLFLNCMIGTKSRKALQINKVCKTLIWNACKMFLCN